jgi:hypothetical protein
VGGGRDGCAPFLTAAPCDEAAAASNEWGTPEYRDVHRVHMAHAEHGLQVLSAAPSACAVSPGRANPKP